MNSSLYCSSLQTAAPLTLGWTPLPVVMAFLEGPMPLATPGQPSSLELGEVMDESRTPKGGFFPIMDLTGICLEPACVAAALRRELLCVLKGGRGEETRESMTSEE